MAKFKVSKDLTDRIAYKLKNNVELTCEEMCYFEQFNVEYWQKIVSMY